MSNIILITNTKGLDRMIGTVFKSRNIKKTAVYITRNKHVQSVIFRQNHQKTIINSSKNHKCVIQTDEKKHVNFHIKQMMHNNTSGQKQLRKMLTDNSLHTSSLEMQSRHSLKCKPRFVKY